MYTDTHRCIHTKVLTDVYTQRCTHRYIHRHTFRCTHTCTHRYTQQSFPASFPPHQLLMFLLDFISMGNVMCGGFPMLWAGLKKGCIELYGLCPGHPAMPPQLQQGLDTWPQPLYSAAASPSPFLGAQEKAVAWPHLDSGDVTLALWLKPEPLTSLLTLRDLWSWLPPARLLGGNQTSHSGSCSCLAVSQLSTAHGSSAQSDKLL
jgi:hypothetical protein